MAKPYFRQIPDFNYVSRKKGDNYISSYIQVKNLFKRGKLRDDIFGNLNFFEKYSIIGDERPDNIAYKFYGDSTLDWVVLISNNIINIQTEWPLSQISFDKVMLDKYQTYDNLFGGIHHYETLEIRNSYNAVILKSGIKMNPTWRTNGNFVATINSKIASIFSGDSIDASSEVKVYMTGAIPNLNVGDQVTIANVSESQYNGTFIVKQILDQASNGVSAFSYNLDFIPNIASPVLANPRKEEVISRTTGSSNIKANSYYYEYYDSYLEELVQVPSSEFIIPVTNYEYEISLEEKKRNIFVLKPTYLSLILNDMDSIMPYKQGGEQYVNRTLKKGDNIRLFT